LSTTAKLFIDPTPEYGQGAKRLQVDCKWSTTTAHLIPGPIELTDEQLLTSLLYRHEAECGRCNTARLWQRADQNLREAVEQTWEQLAAAELRARRN
jgi:hypothetical protein